MSTLDTAYLVLGSFDGKLAIWRGGVFDSKEMAIAEWDDYAAEYEHESSLELVQVLEVSLIGAGHITVGRLDPRK